MSERQMRTVLLVDGDDGTLYRHGILLQRLGYGIMTAKNAASALRTAEESRPSIIVTEIDLTGSNGMDLVRHLRSSETLKPVPVVVLTQKDDAAMRASCLGMGCMSYLIKPVEPQHLYRVIQASTEQVPRTRIRISARLKAVVGNGNSQTAERPAVATMISEGGCFLRTLSPLPRDARAPVQLFVGERKISATGSVLYSAVLAPGIFREPGMGMKFIDIAPPDRKFLRGFIEEQLISDLQTGA